MKWGNYANAEFEYTTTSGEKIEKVQGTIIPTGSTDYTKVNNIYDMAGNVGEFTLENNSYDSKVRRGGYYNGAGLSVKDRNSTRPSVTDIYYGCRAMLYIKWYILTNPKFSGKIVVVVY